MKLCVGVFPHTLCRAVYNTEHGGSLCLKNKKVRGLEILFYKESISVNNSKMEIYIMEEMLYIFLYIAPEDILL